MEHATNHGYVYHRFPGLGSSFVILTVATVPADRSEGPFGYPAFEQDDESLYLHTSRYEL